MPNHDEPEPRFAPTSGARRPYGGLALRRREYFALILPAIALVIFGFFVPAPTPLRLGALVVAAALVPLAAIAGNTRR